LVVLMVEHLGALGPIGMFAKQQSWLVVQQKPPQQVSSVAQADASFVHGLGSQVPLLQ
jgi:hypothetical protein